MTPALTALSALGALGAAGFLLLAAAVAAEPTPPAADRPIFEADGRLTAPPDYRSWVFLSSGFDMSYAESAGAAPAHRFDNVFVQPWAYEAFKATGSWPDGTLLVLENRAAASKGSINRAGSFQTSDVLGLEAHAKDAARFKGGWAFFAFSAGAPAAEIPHAAACYGCHVQHAAVDTTFVQFYPTLQAAAKAHGTFSPAYLAETEKAAR